MDLLDHLRRIPIFERLSPRNLVRLSEICEPREIAAELRLTQQAELGVTFFIIASGEAVAHRVDENGMQKPVDVLREGDYFGTTSLFLGEPRDATVTALTDMQVWMIRRGPFMAMVESAPGMRRELTIPAEIQERLRAPRFRWLDRGEWVVLFTRRHWLWLVRSMTLTTLILVAYFALLALLRIYGASKPPLLPFIAPALVGYLMAFFWFYFDWRDDHFVITNRRISHRERVAFIYESRNEAPLDRVQNINSQSDALGSLFNYATLGIETAADASGMTFPGVPDPEHFEAVIWEQINRAQALRRASQRHKIREALAEHTGLRPIEALPEADGSDLDTPIDEPPDDTWWGQRLGEALIESGLLPRMQIRSDDSVTWRKHWIFLVAEVLLPTGIALLASTLAVLGLMGIPPALVARAPWLPFVTLVLAVLSIGWMWWAYNDWGNDLYIVTNERIIDIEKRPLFFSSKRREASLGMIQNVQLNVPNFLAAALGYGNVVVQTAGAGEFTFDNVPRPHQVQSEIFKRMQAFRQRQEARDASRRRAELAEWFGVYDEMRHDTEAPARPTPVTPPAPPPPTLKPPDIEPLDPERPSTERSEF